MASNQHSQRERTPDRNTQPPPPKMGRYFLESESEEDLEAVPLPPKKKARRSMATIPLSPESEKEETEPPNAVLGVMGFSMPPVRIMHHADGSQSFQKMEERQVRILKTAAQNMEGKEQKRRSNSSQPHERASDISLGKRHGGNGYADGEVPCGSRRARQL